MRSSHVCEDDDDDDAAKTHRVSDQLCVRARACDAVINLVCKYRADAS